VNGARSWRRGLYALTDGSSGTHLLALAEAVLRGGAALLQYRAKATPRALRREEATALLALCRRHGVPLVINDDFELAVATGADGVHLGRDDPPPAQAREALGETAIIGVSCYADPERARAAAAAGADYVAFGSLFTSSNKPGATRAPLELLGAAGRELDLPVCGIGGITLSPTPHRRSPQVPICWP
jgi:thiamine-phosphate pyrophosphorylase